MVDVDETGLLTGDEREAVELAGRVACLLDRIAADGPSRAGDLAELCAAVHTVQNAVLAQAAARAYPDRYRLLGAAVTAAARELRMPLVPNPEVSEWVSSLRGGRDGGEHGSDWQDDARRPLQVRASGDYWVRTRPPEASPDGLPARRCRDGGEHDAHRWGTRIGDPAVPAGLATDAPELAWCPGQSAASDVLLPFLVEAEPGSTGDGLARTLRALRWDCFDRVQLDRRAVELLIDALADRELAEGDVRYFPAQRIHYTVVVDVEGAPHLRPAKAGEIGGDA